MSALVVTLSSIKNLEVEKKACTFPGLLQNQAKLCKLCKPLYFLNLNVTEDMKVGWNLPKMS